MTSWQDLFSSAQDARLSAGEHEAGKLALKAHMEAVRAAPHERLKEHMPRISSPFDAAPGSALTPEEHAAGRASLRRFIAAHPPAATGNIFAFLRFASTPSFAVVALLVCTGGAAYAAEGSMPGEFFHAVKVAVNEPVLAQFHAGETGRTLWALKVLERRAEEARTLAQRDERNPDAWEELERLTAKAGDDAATRIARLPLSVAAVMRDDLAKRLQAADLAPEDAEDNPARHNVFAVLRRVTSEPSVATRDGLEEKELPQIARALMAPSPALELQDAARAHTETDMADEAVQNADAPVAPMMLTAPANEMPMLFKAVPEDTGSTMLQMTAPALMHKRITPPCSASGSAANGACAHSSSASGSLRTSSATSSALSETSPRAPSPAPAEVPPDALPVPGL